MVEYLVVVGATGNVGNAFVNQLYLKGDTDPSKHANPSKLFGMLSSEGFSFDKTGHGYDQATEFSTKVNPGTRYHRLSDVPDIIQSQLSRSDFDPTIDNLVLVDVSSAGEESVNLHKKIHRRGYRIVTANKVPAALMLYRDFVEVTGNPSMYALEPTVMAGAGGLGRLRGNRDVESGIKRIKGMFSGTLAHTMNELEKGRGLYDIIDEAVKKGYAETDPRLDYSGDDVMYKILIAARVAGFPVEISDVEKTPFLPKGLFHAEESIGEFMDRVKAYEPMMTQRVKTAKKKGEVLRYIPQARVIDDAIDVTVGLRSIKTNHRFANLAGTTNILQVVSANYPASSPFEISGPGAGPQVTAENVRFAALDLIGDREIAYRAPIVAKRTAGQAKMMLY